MGLPSSVPITSGPTSKLYDGANVLGVQDNLADTVVPEKFGEARSAIVVNFSSILNATIDARVEFSGASGPVAIYSIEKAQVLVIGPLRGRFPQTDATITGRDVCR